MLRHAVTLTFDVLTLTSGGLTINCLGTNYVNVLITTCSFFFTGLVVERAVKSMGGHCAFLNSYNTSENDFWELDWPSQFLMFLMPIMSDLMSSVLR